MLGDKVLSVIVLVAAFFRTYRLESLTEFLGDQGRTMIIMDDFVRRGIVPLSGPTTLSGHNLGPFFYYLLLPGYVLTRSPLGVSFWMALLGVLSVVVLYDLTRRMFGVLPARTISLAWAVSPFIIRADRVIWEPNLVPLYSLLFVYLLYRAHHEQKNWMWILLGATVGILVQLHYPNVFFIGLTGLYLISIRRRFIRITLLSFSGFVLVLLPFMYYEYTVGFRDLVGIALVFSGSVGETIGKRMMLERGLESAFRVFGRVLPFMSRQTVSVVILSWIAFLYRFPRKRNVFLTVWLFGGLLGMARFSGVLHDHYLYFLVPVPFLMLASVLGSVSFKKIACVIVVILTYFQFSKTDMFTKGNNDIQRVRGAVQSMREDVGSEPFSFTLVSSRSFSDLHYRYYMNVMNLTPQKISDGTYRKLVLICDNDTCPIDVASWKETGVLCYDKHCKEFYPTIHLAEEWKYEATKGRLYVFERL